MRAALPGAAIADQTNAPAPIDPRRRREVVGAQEPVPRVVVGVAAASLALLPLLRPSGPGNSSPVDVLLGLTIAVTFVWAVRSRLRLHLPYAVPVAIIVGAGAIAGLAGPFPSLSLLQLVQDLVLFAWCAALVNIALSPGAFQLLVRAWSAAAIGWAAILVVAYFGDVRVLSGTSATQGPRASLLAGDPNLLATYFVVSILVVAATRYPERRWLRIAAYLILLGGLALTFSNGGVAALAVGVAVGLMLAARRRWGPVGAAVPAALGVLAVGAVLWSGLSLANLQAQAHASSQPLLQNSIGRSQQSGAERTTIFQESTALFQEHGWLGLGPRATKSELAAQQAPYVNEAHDDYFAAVIERGLLGGVGLLVLIAAIAFRARALIRAGPSPALRASLPHPGPLVGAAVAMAASGTNEQVFHFRHVWALLALIAAYHLLWTRER